MAMNSRDEAEMKCEICGQHEGTVPVKQVVNGVVKETVVCQECAQKISSELESPLGMMDFLFGVGAKPEAGPGDDDLACADCGMKRRDFRKSSRLGCARCYTTFAEDLKPMLAAMHRGVEHVGKIPATEKATAQIRSLQTALQQAVARQDFEEAARLRDAIRVLKSEAGAVGAKAQGDSTP
jgi:protein arginine kinase activator